MYKQVKLPLFHLNGHTFEDPSCLKLNGYKLGLQHNKQCHRKELIDTE